MPFSIRLLRRLLLGALLLTTIPLTADTASPLEGLWYGEPVHDGATGHVALRVKTDDKGRMIGMLSLLDIDVHDLAFGLVVQEGADVTIGPLKLAFDAETDTLSGTLPEAIVPVYRIPFTLHRTTELPSAERVSSEAPVVRPRWTFDAGSPLWGGLAAKGGQLAFGTDDGSVVLLDGASGKESWRYATGGKIRTRPLFVDDDLIVASDDGFLYRIEVANGELRWKARLGEAQSRPVAGEKDYDYDNYASSPVLHGDVLYVGFGGDLLALDSNSGKSLWRESTGGAVSTTPGFEGDRVFVGSFDGKLYAIDAASGETIWTHDFGAAVTSSPVVVGGLVIAGSRSYDLTAFDAKSGDRKWSHYEWFSWIESSPIAMGRTIYVGSSDAQKLRAFDASSGKVRWTFDTGGSAWAQPAATGERVYIGSVGVANYIVDHRATFWSVDRRTGHAAWRFDLPRPEGKNMWGFAASPVVDEAHVYVATLGGQVLAFAAK